MERVLGGSATSRARAEGGAHGDRSALGIVLLLFVIGVLYEQSTR